MARFSSRDRGRITATVLRLVFAAVFGTTGFLLGRELELHALSPHVAGAAAQFALLVATPVAGAIAGVLLVPAAQGLFEKELASVERAIDRMAPGELVGGAVGLVTGLIVAFLVKNVLFEVVALGGRAGSQIALALYIVLSVFAAILGARVGAKHRVTIARLATPVGAAGGGSPKLLDTSVIIDGRILEIVQSGFLEGPLLVPRFVLRELHLVADSADPLKRSRGRRGLELLTKLQTSTPIEIVERDPQGEGVDGKLVALARERDAKLVTNDFNLNRVARLEGVSVLNINELAGAVRPILLPGEDLRVTIVKAGRELSQGVGYLEDGTMIVVEGGRDHIGETVEVAVTSSLQTAAGRMIFARAKART